VAWASLEVSPPSSGSWYPLVNRAPPGLSLTPRCTRSCIDWAVVGHASTIVPITSTTTGPLTLLPSRFPPFLFFFFLSPLFFLLLQSFQKELVFFFGCCSVSEVRNRVPLFFPQKFFPLFHSCYLSTTVESPGPPPPCPGGLCLGAECPCFFPPFQANFSLFTGGNPVY